MTPRTGVPEERARQRPRLRSLAEDYPLRYTTGRTAYQFHTRTKTGRSRPLNDAAPDPWVEAVPADAEPLGIGEGDRARVESPCGAIEVRARIGTVMPGAVFAPFHYGHWDPARPRPRHRPRLANELTMTVWDPVSKQPYFKTAACRVIRLRDGNGPSPAPTTAASAPAHPRWGQPRTPPPPGRATSQCAQPVPHYALDPPPGRS